MITSAHPRSSAQAHCSRAAAYSSRAGTAKSGARRSYLITHCGIVRTVPSTRFARVGTPIRSPLMVLGDTVETFEIADESAESLHALVEEHGWGDGLPIVAPTEARVQAMLAAHGADADTVLGMIPDRESGG